jgi:hypothetical protein
MERSTTQVINIYMRIDEVLTAETDIEEWKASKELCRSNRSDSSLGSSALSSCRSQGLRRRDSKVKATFQGKRQKIGNRKIKGKAHGGPLPDWS